MPHIPRPEHPRPDFERKTWQNLNGKWQFAIDSAKCGLEKGWHSGTEFPEEILVPFCPESKLSGIANTDFLESVWYRRLFRVEERLHGGRLHLHFGAVDYDARIWVNGTEAARHRGGYTPFSADVTDVIDPHGENEIVVHAVDDERSYDQPLGKQSDRLESHGCSYTRTTGIWQTVWLEAVPETHIEGLTTWPDAANGRVGLEVTVRKPEPGLSVKVVASADGKTVAETLISANHLSILSIDVPNPVLWEPGKPFLYDLKLYVMDGERVIDEVSSYFGLRDVRIDGDRVLINEKPVFLRLVLDQGFWPDGVYTAPSDDDLRADIERGIATGFNGARLHQKLFEPRTLYWADKLGYLLWSEFPDWPCDTRTHPQARENFLREWIDAVLRDRSHPSIIAWVPFNEAGMDGARFEPQFFREICDITNRLDPTRPVVDNSGWQHVKTDIWDIHDYDQNPKSLATRYEEFAVDPKTETLPRFSPDIECPYLGQPVVISEFGGTWWNPEAVESSSWGYGERPKSTDELGQRICGLARALIDNPHIAGFCYTQLTDVEQEANGLYTFDRRAKIDPEIISGTMTKRAAIESGSQTRKD